MSTERNGRPASAPDSTRIVVPLLPQSNTCSDSRQPASPVPLTVTALAPVRIATPSWVSAVFVRVHVVARGQVGQGAAPGRHRGKQQCPVRDRLVAREAEPAVQGACSPERKLLGQRHARSVRDTAYPRSRRPFSYTSASMEATSSTITPRPPSAEWAISTSNDVHAQPAGERRDLGEHARAVGHRHAQLHELGCHRHSDRKVAPRRARSLEQRE